MLFILQWLGGKVNITEVMGPHHPPEKENGQPGWMMVKMGQTSGKDGPVTDEQFQEERRWQRL